MKINVWQRWIWNETKIALGLESVLSSYIKERQSWGRVCVSRCFGIVNLFNDIHGSLFGLVEDPADVLTNNADADQLNASEE